MTEIFDIAGYARISFEDDDIKDKDNTSIENQKAIITDFVLSLIHISEPTSPY